MALPSPPRQRNGFYTPVSLRNQLRHPGNLGLLLSFQLAHNLVDHLVEGVRGESFAHRSLARQPAYQLPFNHHNPRVLRSDGIPASQLPLVLRAATLNTCHS
ncbi:MAG: hypothetical protein KIT83_12445 [Bryobacterales bacterium]|nr:hypothetical protein [Bryobacterales bacterium]